MDRVQKYENEEAIKALKKATEFVYRDGTENSLAETTLIGKKYVSVNGNEKKEITVTKTNTIIVDFTDGKYQSRDVVFYDNSEIRDMVNVLVNKMENKKPLSKIWDYIKSQLTDIR